MKIRNFTLTFMTIITLMACKEKSLDFYEEVQPLLADNTTIQLKKDGRYILNIEDKGTFHISNLKNLTIEGNGATIVCNKQQQAFHFKMCENLTLSNLIIEYDPLCSTQGTILNISDDNRTFEVQIHEGYPMPDPKSRQDRIQIYDKATKELIRNYQTTHIEGKIETDSINRILTFNIYSPKAGVYKPGDYIVLNNVPEGLPPHCFEMDRCRNTIFEDVTIYDSPHFSVLEYDCHNSYYHRCIIDRKINDPKRPEDRLRSGLADGINSNGATKGPKIESCIIKHQGDDGIAISGTLYPVYKTDKAERKIYFLTNDAKAMNARFKKGDKVVCMANDGTVRQNAHVTEVSDASPQPTQEEVNACFRKLPDILNYTNFTIGIGIQLDEWIEGASSGDLVYSNDRIGNGFEIVDCEVGHNRSRGLLIKSGEGVIRNNLISGCAMSGLALCPEIFWMGAGLANNMEISNNTIEKCMFESDLKDFYQSAAFVVMSEAPCGGYAPAGAMQNINIHDNKVIGCPRPSMVLTSIDSGSIYNNEVIPDTTMIRRHGANNGIINTQDCQEINLKNIKREQP